MPKLERSEWYDLCRDMNWHFKYVTEAEVFPEVLSQSHGPLGVRFNPSPSDLRRRNRLSWVGHR
jgi:hypothetical protein